jgi:hypothetical protein
MKAAETQRAKLIDLFVQAEMAARLTWIRSHACEVIACWANPLPTPAKNCPLGKGPVVDKGGEQGAGSPGQAFISLPEESLMTNPARA